MSKVNNIDELLQERFKDFAPDAPNVWQGIQQGMQATQAASGIPSGSIKGVTLGVKIIAIVAVATSITIGVVMYKNSLEPISTITQITPTDSILIPEHAVLEEQNQITQTPIVKDKKGDATKNLAKPKQEEVLPIQQQEIVENTETVLPFKQQTVIEATPPPVVDKPVIVSEKQTQLVIKPEPKINQQPTKLPYNPNADKEGFETPFTPGSFSPDGDGINDTYIILIENEQLFNLVITDKNGKTVFESNDKTITWDGRDYKSGNICAPGPYPFVFQYQFKGAQNQQTKKGVIALF